MLQYGLIGLVLLVATPAGARQQAPFGPWLTETGNLEIAIAPCGARLCGIVTRVINNRSMAAQARNGRPAYAGMKILTNVRRSGYHYRGRLFNRDDGKTYDCNIRIQADGSLQIRAYVLSPLIGRTQVWRRPPAPVTPRVAR